MVILGKRFILRRKLWKNFNLRRRVILLSILVNRNELRIAIVLIKLGMLLKLINIHRWILYMRLLILWIFWAESIVGLNNLVPRLSLILLLISRGLRMLLEVFPCELVEVVVWIACNCVIAVIYCFIQCV